VLIYDGDCPFCRRGVRAWLNLAPAAETRPFQDAEVRTRFPELASAQLDAAVHWLGSDGLVCAGAEAVWRALALAPGWPGPLRHYRKVPAFAEASDAAYAWIAEHRQILTRWMGDGGTTNSEFRIPNDETMTKPEA
jgi:predicted DCC family thiol-disulfide oxidoreductase YuxK